MLEPKHLETIENFFITLIAYERNTSAFELLSSIFQDESIPSVKAWNCYLRCGSLLADRLLLLKRNTDTRQLAKELLKQMHQHSALIAVKNSGLRML